MRVPRPTAGLLAGGVAALGVLAGGGLWLRDSEVVAVRQVTVTGVSGPQAAEIRAALTDAAKEMTTLHVRHDALVDATRRFPIVRGVEADPDLLHTLRIHVSAYTPVAAVAVGGRRTAVAGDGTILPDTPLRGLAVVSGEATGTNQLRAGRAARLVELLDAAPAALRGRVSAAAVERDGLTLELRDGPKLVFGDLRGLEAKWAAASRVLADPGSEGATYVDVRVPERPAAGGLAPMGEGPADEPTVPTAPTTPTTPPAAPQSTPPAAQTTPPATAQPGTSGAPTAQVGQPSTSGTG